MHRPLLAPSLLAADHAALAEGLAQAVEAGVQWVHLDIMDGHFAPNLSFGPDSVAALRRRQPRDLFFDVHLMLSHPDRFIDAFQKAGADSITIHVEADCDLPATLAAIRALGCQTGLALNPDTPAEAARPYLADLDLILVMTVWPGFGGQSFIDKTLATMQQLHAWRTAEGHQFRLEVDGGIGLDTAAQCRVAGVDTFVAGTAFFKAPDRAAFRAAIER